MSTEHNKQVVRRMTADVWNRGQLDVLDEICSPAYELRGMGGLAELKEVIAAYRRSFPDLCFTVEEMIAEGDTVVARWTLRATHLGEFEGIAPTGKVLTDTGISLYHLADGKILDDCFESSMPDTRSALLAAD